MENRFYWGRKRKAAIPLFVWGAVALVTLFIGGATALGISDNFKALANSIESSPAFIYFLVVMVGLLVVFGSKMRSKK